MWPSGTAQPIQEASWQMRPGAGALDSLQTIRSGTIMWRIQEMAPGSISIEGIALQIYVFTKQHQFCKMIRETALHILFLFLFIFWFFFTCKQNKLPLLA